MKSNKKIRIESFVLEKMKSSGLPALSMAIILNDEIIFKRGFGRRNYANGKSATPKTLYNIGSVAKSFASLSIMQLQEQGKLKILDLVSKYLDICIRPKRKNIKIKDLMTHTSGIPALGYAGPITLNAVGENVQYYPIGNVKDMLTYINCSKNWVETEPGKRWFYLNEGYVLLGGIVEKVSDLSYKEYLKKYIIKPLNMNRTFFSKEEVESDSDFAQPYLINDFICEPKSYLYGDIVSDGGIISNTEDMAKYINLYINKGKTGVISEESIKEMMKPRIPIPINKFFVHKNDKIVKADFDSEQQLKHYAYGLIVDKNIKDHTVIGHGGNSLVASAHMDFVPKNKIGVIILTNGTGYSLDNISKYVLSILLEKSTAQLSFRQSEIHLNSLAGLYKGYKNSTSFIISRDGDFLKMKNTDSSLTKENIILVPYEFSNNEYRFFTLSNGKRIMADFQVKENSVELIYERFKLIKK